MKNKELFDKANEDNDLELKEKLRNDFMIWCKENKRTAQSPLALTDWWNETVKWQN